MIRLSKVARYKRRPQTALSRAKKAVRILELVEKSEEPHGREDLRVEAAFALGASKLMSAGPEEARKDLEDALEGCRRIAAVVREPEIRIEHARLFHARGTQKHGDLKHLAEAIRLGHDALEIAEECGYRLDSADCYLFLANCYRALGDGAACHRHAEKAMEYASCGVDPMTSTYYYQRTYRAAEALHAVRS